MARGATLGDEDPARASMPPVRPVQAVSPQGEADVMNIPHRRKAPATMA